MKDNISIVFAALIGVFLIVILPLFSILDRQDSMSYNVVLNETTKFVDEIRNNGFIDIGSYRQYISSLSSTSNTYKVIIEAYKKKLIHDTDVNGNIINDKYIEERELYNTKDILEALEKNNYNEDSNINGNVYLFSENDEIYVRVYNTNITSGSLLYRFIIGESNTNVIDINYGGIINNVNWELYKKLNESIDEAPEVILTVPVNANNESNIKKETNSITQENYSYVYDLKVPANKTIKVSLELRNITTLNVALNGSPTVELASLINNDTNFNAVKNQLLSYIELYGMYADKSISLRKNNEYYVFDVTLTNVRMSFLGYISNIANIGVKAGLGQDENGVLTYGAKSVDIELVDEDSVNSVVISTPFIFKELIRSNLERASINGNELFVDEDIAFIVSYTGINEQSDDDIANAIRNNLIINGANYAGIEVFTLDSFKNKYGALHIAPLLTSASGHTIIKFRYTSKNENKNNYIEIKNNWIETNIEYTEEEIEDTEGRLYAEGAQSEKYSVYKDELPPVEPSIVVNGTMGDNDWYTSSVSISIIESELDMYMKNGVRTYGGSGVYKNYLKIGNDKNEYKSPISLSTIGTYNAVAYAEDYIGNEAFTSTRTIKIDNVAPTKPSIKVEKGTMTNNGWYTSDVTIGIEPGVESVGSGVSRTTYEITGANRVLETQGTTYKLTKEGTSTVIARTYDKAGNFSEKSIEIKIDKTTPATAQISVIKGTKASEDSSWYNSNVEVAIQINTTDSVSGYSYMKYGIKEKNSGSITYTDYSGTYKTLSVNNSGEYEIVVITYSLAGNSATTTFELNIDKNAPEPPIVKIIKGTLGNSGWYKSYVRLNVKTNGDTGGSGISGTLKYYLDDNEYTINNNEDIVIDEEGNHTLKVYSYDNAGNRKELTMAVKIDKTNPTGDFVINGSYNEATGWYTSNIQISYEANDNTSGVSGDVYLSTTKIEKDTAGTNVILTINDNAGNTFTKEKIIKVDNTDPTIPTINTDAPTGNGMVGVLAFNKPVSIEIIPGTDVTSGVNRTTYKVTRNGSTIVSERPYISNYEITANGRYVIIVRTYDNAGNYSENSKTIWKDDTKPQTPKITTINGEKAGDYLRAKGNTPNVTLGLSSVDEGNEIEITLINEADRSIEKKYGYVIDGSVSFKLDKKGNYNISIKQINMYGTESEISGGVYYYEYI